MPIVIGVKFASTSKVYFFDPADYFLSVGDKVIVETQQGLEMAEVAVAAHEVADDDVVKPLKAIVRAATPKDIESAAAFAEKRESARRLAHQKITDSKLDMKLVDVEYTFDGAKLIIYFTADGRVDFRELVRELAFAFKTRIELKQIGGRDEVKRLGGIAHCGRVCCCASHLESFAHTNIKMAKTQSLSLNPTKISGLCGRLMCCLSYENATYAEINKRCPKLGSSVKLADGRVGTVVSIAQLREQVRVKVQKPDETIEFVDVPLAEVAKPEKADGRAEDQADQDTEA